VTRLELEDRANAVSELHTKVEELKLNNEYQLKLKEMTYSEKVKEINGEAYVYASIRIHFFENFFYMYKAMCGYLYFFICEII
jgi:hypothetical protein